MITDDDLIRDPVISKPAPYVTITSGMRGYFAVLMWWNDEGDDGVKLPAGQGFWEPWQSGIGSYRNEAGAILEARQWAQAEGLEYRRG
jgi:hypothetical protein